jgi:HlyD family secretion protein
MVVIGSVVVILILVLVVSVVPGGDRGDALVAYGTVEATEARLGFQVPGRIDSVGVREGDPVTAGQELAWLDREEVLARRSQAEAQVAHARALLRELERGFRREEVAQARAARDAAQERLADAEHDLARAEQLYEGGAISREVYDKAAVVREVAVHQRAQAEEQLKLLEAGPRPERIEAQRAQLAQARASLRAIEATLANMTVVAPVDVKLGTAATITTDTYRERSYAGEVMFLASEAEFTPKSVQTTEERVKLVYAVKVRITGDAAFDLKPGMPADVRLALESS